MTKPLPASPLPGDRFTLGARVMMIVRAAYHRHKNGSFWTATAAPVETERPLTLGKTEYVPALDCPTCGAQQWHARKGGPK